MDKIPFFMFLTVYLFNISRPDMHMLIIFILRLFVLLLVVKYFYFPFFS